MTEINQCRRCSCRLVNPGMCFLCMSDLLVERDELGVTIGPELWPIDGLAEFHSQVALVGLEEGDE